MRPTDENQPGSRRPNLMSSSRRANGEISILAMLDGKSRRSLARRFPSLPALLGYAAAGTAACALVGVLAWLAHDGMDGSAGKEADGKAVTIAHAPAAPSGAEAEAETEAAAPDAATSHAPLPAASDADAPRPAGRAAIVEALNADVPAPRTPAADGAPPPREAQSMPAAIGAPATPSAPSASAAVAVATATAAAAPPARNPPPKSVIVRPLATYRPAQPAVRSATPARPKRNAAPTKPAAAAVDMDVALITAIIQHAGRLPDATSVEHPDATCAGKPCGPRMPEQP